MTKSKILIICIIVLIFGFLKSSEAQEKSFKCIVLGNSGGYEGNLSSYMLAEINSDRYICLDAGTLYNGIKIAIKGKSFGKFKLPKSEKIRPELYILRNYIKAYLISHTHLDHIAALITNAPEDSPKYIYGTQSIIGNLNNYIFNWEIAANYGSIKSESEPPLKKYKYVDLQLDTETNIFETEMTVIPFNLSHYNNKISTAFLIKAKNNFFLYFGDTGSDETERNTNLSQIWHNIAPLIREKKLNAIMIECSFPEDQSDNNLFGHLTPKLLNKELNQLAKIVNFKDPENALKGLKIFITHIKPTEFENENMQNIIKYQLEKLNILGVKYIFPEQGEKLEF